jgi:hypothetical protein
MNQNKSNRTKEQQLAVDLYQKVGIIYAQYPFLIPFILMREQEIINTQNNELD